MTKWKTIFYIAGILPLGFIISLLAFYVHSGFILGYLPRYNQPDPKTIDVYQSYYTVIDWCGNIWIISFPIWIALVAIYVILRRKNIYWRPVIFSALSHICTLALLLSPIIEWYAD